MAQGTYRLLVVDDSLTNRTLLTHSLQKAGYETIEASDGPRALEIARAQLPDLMLLDVSMPGMDGFEVCSLLKADQATCAIPIVFLTALSSADDIQRAFAVGGSDYVRKPFHLGEIKARVSVHLQLRRAAEELKETHVRLLHAQKLESIGQLAAGIAHEINTPTQYVGDNLLFLREAFDDVLPLVRASSDLARAVLAGEGAREAGALQEALEAADLEYLAEEIPRAFAQSVEGVGRVTSIVRGMKEFSHPGQKDPTSVDLNRAIESTLTVATNEWKYVAKVETDFDPELPPVRCVPGEINQVVLNMIVNAAHAIADVVGDGAAGKGTIRVGTRRDGDFVEIRIADTGSGIPDGARERVFDPFFTTKGVGKGTGQGLAIAHDVVVKKHGGALSFETEIGKGTTFSVRLPLKGAGAEREAA